ncbi:MAG: Ig-like domain repeat protein [Nitrosotalea sp.]
MWYVRGISFIPIMAAVFISVILSNNAYADPSISMSTTNAVPGSVIQISGNGFSSSDTSVTVNNLQGTEIFSYTPISGLGCQSSRGGLVPPSGTFVCPAVAYTQETCPVSGGSFSCYFMVPSVPSAEACNSSSCAGNELGFLSATGSSGDEARLRASITEGMSIVPNEGTDATTGTLYGTGYLGTVKLAGIPIPITDVSLSLFGDDTNVNGLSNNYFYQAVIFGIAGSPVRCLPAPTGQLSDNGPCTFPYGIVGAPGVHTITAAGLISGDVPDKTYTSSFLVTSSSGFIFLSENSGSSGSIVNIIGQKFDSTDTSVKLFFGSSDITPPSGCPVSSGSFSCNVVIPPVTGTVSGNIAAVGNVLGDSASNFFTAFPAATISTSPSSGPLGTEITITGSGFVSGVSHVSIFLQQSAFFFPYGTNCSVSDGSINGKCSISIPISSGLSPGPYTLIAQGDQGDGGSTTFNVSPSPTFSFSPISGLPGSSATVTGSDFESSDTSVVLSLGSTNVTSSSGCPVAGGAFSCIITIPEISQGFQVFTAIGNAGDGSELPFQVLGPTINPSVTSGTAGTEVTVTGTYFATSDTSVTLSLGSTNITPSSDCPVSGGTFSCVVIVPPVSAGTYPISAVGSSGDSGPTAGFLVLNAVSISQSSGPPGTQITVTGSSFAISDTSATFTFGSTNVTPSSGCPVVGGVFACVVTIPSISAGSYSITVTGSSGDEGVSNFGVGNGVSISPSSGSIGSLINVSGTGFFRSPVTITFIATYGTASSDTIVATCPASGASNTLLSITSPCSFNIPVESPGAYTISASDAINAATFTTSITIPPRQMTVLPTFGTIGSTVTVNGSGLSSSDTSIHVNVSGNGDTKGILYDVFCPASDGYFTCSFTIPPNTEDHFPVTGGSYSLEAISQPEPVQDFLTATLTVTPSITVSPSSGHLGSSVTVIGAGFASSDTSATLLFGSTNVTPSSGCPVNGGSFSCVITVPPAEGNSTISAKGTSGDIASNGFVIEKSLTTTTVSSPVNPSLGGQPVVFTAIVSPTSSSGTPTGTVQFSINGTNEGAPVSLSGGTVTLDVANLATGKNIVTAYYSGDADFENSNNTASGFVQVVNKHVTTTTVLSSINPSIFGHEAIFVANITTDSLFDLPSGTVTFYDGSTSIGTASIQGVVNPATGSVVPQAMLQNSSISIGAHSITASYQGDDNFLPSTSSAITQTIVPPAPIIINPQNNTESGPIPDITGVSVTGGTITIYNDTVQLGVSTVSSNGTWLFVPTVPLAQGQYFITATDTADGQTSEHSPLTIFTIDTIPPVTTATPSGTEGKNNWYISPVSVTLSATDNPGGSGVKSTAYSLDGGPERTYSGPIAITGDSNHTLTFNSTDNAGNMEQPNILHIAIDTTNPVIVVPSDITVYPTSVSGREVTFSSTNGTLATATDATSGIDKITYSPPSGSTFPIGQTTVTVTVTDNAGNVATGTFHVTVLTPTGTSQQLIATITSMNLDHGTTNSLDTKLNASISSLNSGNTIAAKNQLNAFINEVNAQAGKNITPSQAMELIQTAQDIINSIQ